VVVQLVGRVTSRLSLESVNVLVRDLLDLVERNGVIAPVVEAGCAGGFVASHLLRDFQLAAVLQVRGDAGGAEAVAADLIVLAPRYALSTIRSRPPRETECERA
jgi:hypothetical protein